MQVQTINNNNTNFKAITEVKYKGKDFRKNPQFVQSILEKIVPNEKYNFSGKSVSVVAKSKDYSDFGYRMLYGITSDDPLIKYKTVELLFYENLQGNMFSRAWKHIKGFFAKHCTKRGVYSQAHRKIAPYKILGRGNSFQTAFDDAMHMLDIGATPSQHFHRGWYD